MVADLSLLAETRRACDEFLATHARLDVLLLNANAITQTRTLTAEGHEANLALGFLSRALMAQLLTPALEGAARPQILTVVGLNKQPHLDLDDLTMKRGFSGMKALGRWQWAMQIYAREWNVRERVPMNVYMPGIVKTKILGSEPNLLLRTLIKVVYAVRATTVDQSAEYIAGVVRDVEGNGRRDAYYSVKTLKARRDLEDGPGDQAALWDWASGFSGRTCNRTSDRIGASPAAPAPREPRRAAFPRSAVSQIDATERTAGGDHAPCHGAVQ